MLQHYAAVRRVATAIANAAETAVQGLQEGRIQVEETFTDRMIGAIEHRLGDGVTTAQLIAADESVKSVARKAREERDEDRENLEHLGLPAYRLDESTVVTWSAMTLTAHQPGAQEKEFGADFLGALMIQLPDYELKKGFLSQAKLVEPKSGMSSQEFGRLQVQCNKMLEHSSDSFVFLYSRRGIRVASALGVAAMKGENNPYRTYTRSLERFFEEHLQCFVGDGAIRAANAASLEAMREQLNARTGFLLKAEGS